ncbi:flagellar hook-associated protein FlgK [Roseovarius sp. LXJ103]|uniref:flagellar hook-associated protein FlgK n=1 Tax=Roseovarius carneus TaxID=2853164 RepID=UPI0015E80053|nr:flagellar hook-associated protein FlgK [Roseovarius carneus]MBZ8117558.1 flagellar hook-associated protein FlgK [Roseovarius carneus]
MSISSALSSALSGLTANSRAAGIVASNLANIQTDGYGRRDVELISERNGGTRIVGITRNVDSGTLGDRRMADGGLARAETRTAFLQSLQSNVGTPDQPGSLSGRIAALEASLVSAASRPDANDRLQAVAQRGQELAKGLVAASDAVQAQRMDAEGEIAFAVRSVNTALGQVQSLNAQILDARIGGFDTSSLEDQRQVVVDRISEFVPVSEVARGNGGIALMTPGGALLVDGTVATLGFEPSNVIMPHMTAENGLLTGLTINGREIDAGSDRSPLAGGKLQALFEVRDDLAVNAQTQLDALARDMIERFQAPGLDATRAPGDPGVFTDAGVVFDPANEVGISGRMALNDLVNPAQAGEVWRLRDGLGAGTPGPAGDATLLSAFGGALTERSAMASGDLGVGLATSVQHMSNMVSRISQAQLTEDRNTSFAAAQQSELQERLLSDGVDSDAELQLLLLIEQSYGANARMLQVLDEMMETLLRI